MSKTSLKYRPLTKDLCNKAKILELAGDEARIRILCVMFEQKGVCVSDIAKALKMSVASVSHHLQLLQDSGLLSSKRKGKNICYSLNKDPLMKYIKQLICFKA